MCTIITIDQTFWNNNEKAVISRVRADAVNNSEGWCLLGIDIKNPENDIKINTMKVNFIPKMIEEFFHHSSSEGRIFLHARAATTSNVGIAYTHGFDDQHGRIIMHNGVIKNTGRLAVDSFNLAVEYDISDAETLLNCLKDYNETFANIFVIEPSTGFYSVVRMSVGSLHSDGKGNFSTNVIGAISTPVPLNSGEDFFIEEDTLDTWDKSWIDSVSNYDEEPSYRFADRYSTVSKLLMSEQELVEQAEWRELEEREELAKLDRVSGWKRAI